MRKLSTLLFFFFSLPLLTSAQLSLGGDPPTGFGCSMCQVLDSDQELVPCSTAWRELMAFCATPACADYARYVSRAPPVASCTNTPNPLPGGTASVGFSFGSWITVSRGTTTGTGGFSSVVRTTPGSGATTSTRAGTGTSSGAPTAIRTATPGSNDTATSGGSNPDTVEPPTPTGAGTGAPAGTNSGPATATGGVGRVVAGGLGVGWLWEAVFMFWGAVW